MKDLIVVIPYTEVRGMMTTYLRQLEKAEIETSLVKLLDIPNGNAGGTHGYAISLMRKGCERFADYKAVIFSDAFDVLFYGTKQQVLDKIPQTFVLMAAERNCYPDPLNISGDTPWKYVNCGLTAGTPLNILRWLQLQELHPEYDQNGLNQRFFNKRRQEGSELAFIDETTNLFYCLFGECGELEFQNEVPVNTLFGTMPNFIHANGKCGFAPMFTEGK